MQFIVDKKDLKKALVLVKSCLPVKPLTEFDANPVFHAVEGCVRVVATDMTQVCSLSIPAESSEAFSVSMDYKKLEKVLSKSENGKVKIDYDQKAGRARVSSDGDQGYVDIPTLNVDKCPAFDRSYEGEAPLSEGSLASDVLAVAVDFASAFMPDVLERNPKYDFILVKDGLVYAANGMNRRGYFASQALRYPSELKILKRFSSVMPKVLKSLEGKPVLVRNLSRAISMTSEDGTLRYACIKARTDSPDIPLSYLKAAGPYTTMELTKCVKAMEKVVIPDYQAAGAAIGVDLVMKPSAEADGSSGLELRLISSGKFSGHEVVPCKRVGEEGTGLLIEKVIDFKMFKELASSFTADGELRWYMNDPESKFFKIQQRKNVGTTPCLAVAVGTYARVNKVV